LVSDGFWGVGNNPVVEPSVIGTDTRPSRALKTKIQLQNTHKRLVKSRIKGVLEIQEIHEG
jgi:hypothetical protein